jgi:hypothetical protein
MTMILIDETQIILSEAGYKTKYPTEIDSAFYFEDRSLLGFVAICSSVDDLIQNWRGKEGEFLKRHARRLRDVPQKAWNAYSVFLTSEEVKDTPMKAKLLTIEEDFQGTRKIARVGLISHEDVVRALFPLLPIQNLVTLVSEDLFMRLRDRVDLPQRSLSALLKGVDSKEIARILLEEK